MKHILLTTLCLALTASGLLAADKPAKLDPASWTNGQVVAEQRI
jgi:hypothetical protein